MRRLPGVELHERSDGRPGRAGRHLFRRTGARESGAANDRFRGTADPGHAEHTGHGAGRRHRAGRRGDFRPQPASRTRTGGSGEFTIPDDQKVFRLDILQFNGTGTQAQLVKKAAYISEDGDYTRYEFSGLELVDSGKEKNRIVILGNADPALAGKLQEKTSGTEGTKYESLLQERISRTGETDTSFPLVPRNQTDLPVFSGMAVTIVTSGSQIGVELMRNVAKVNFSFFLTEPMRKAYDEWDIVLNTIPPASFYIPQAYEAPFPNCR